MQVFSVHLECANADSHVHILDEPPVLLYDAHAFGKYAMHVFLSYVAFHLGTLDRRMYDHWWSFFLCVCVYVCVYSLT